MTQFKGEVDYCTLIVRDFNTPLSITNRTSTQKINKEVGNMKITIHQLGLTDMLHSTTAKYTFSRIGHILGHITSLCKFLKIGNIENIFSDHSGMKLEPIFKKKGN